MKNKWKFGFFLLLGLNTIIVLSILLLINLPAYDKKETTELQQTAQSDVKFQVNANKADLNRMINHYIEEEGLTSPIRYEINLEDEVELLGMMQVFNQEIEMMLTFEPEALPNGDLILNQKSISIGQLQLPVPFVLNFVREQYDFPDWVSIQPNDELVYVSLQRMKLKSDISVKVDKFDLKNDEILFTLGVPTN